MDIYGHASILWIDEMVAAALASDVGADWTLLWCRLDGWLLPDCAMADLAGFLPGFLPGLDGGSRCLLDVFGAPAASMATRFALPAKGVHKTTLSSILPYTGFIYSEKNPTSGRASIVRNQAP